MDREAPTERATTLLEPELAAALERLAQANDRSLSAEVRHLIRSHMEAVR
jgi:hypothetical protein